LTGVEIEITIVYEQSQKEAKKMAEDVRVIIDDKALSSGVAALDLFNTGPPRNGGIIEVNSERMYIISSTGQITEFSGIELSVGFHKKTCTGCNIKDFLDKRTSNTLLHLLDQLLRSPVGEGSMSLDIILRFKDGSEYRCIAWMNRHTSNSAELFDCPVPPNVPKGTFPLKNVIMDGIPTPLDFLKLTPQ
jgi:hypothetical protein